MTVNLKLKRGARNLVDRVVRPYISELEATVRSTGDTLLVAVTSESSGSSVGEPDGWQPPSADFHMAIHELRTLELESVPKGSREVLSIGAQGGWYFEWFRQAYGDVDRHVGVEAFENRPDDLPEYAVWIENTADQMHDVESDSIDLVFAGQTTEHLWAHELVGFLVEAHRVLRDGGLLVVDSPNRLVTEHLCWSHGGHSIEISAAEASHLFELAGFDVIDVHGVWNCVRDGRVIELEEGIEAAANLVRRATTGRARPDECFVWWINARRSDRDPDVGGLTAEVQDLFERHWLTRVSRGFFAAPNEPLSLNGGESGRIAATLPFMLHAGRWTVSLRLKSGAWSDVDRPRLVLELPGEHEVHSWELGGDDEFSFELPSVYFALSLVLAAESVRAPITIEFPIELRHVG